jgi:hypothetical protein
MILVLLLALGLLRPAAAGIFFGKKKTINPRERVPELLAIIKSDGDKKKRADAVEELRGYDAAQFPEIVPALIDVLLGDKDRDVRAEAAQSLGKIRPVSQAAGLALEQAQSGDDSMRVRLQARSALLQYHWAGYKSGSGKKDEPLITTKEPPLADAPEPAPPEERSQPVIRKTRISAPRFAPLPVSRRVAPTAPEPAPRGAAPVPPLIGTPSGTRPLPPRPTVPTTAEPPLAPAAPTEEGPSLNP